MTAVTPTRAGQGRTAQEPGLQGPLVQGPVSQASSALAPLIQEPSRTGPGIPRPARPESPTAGRPEASTARPGPPTVGRPGAPLTGRPEAALLRPADEEAEVRAITRGTVQAAMEVLAGIRPIHQLARRLDPRCLSALQHRGALIRRELMRSGNPELAKLHRNSTVRSVRVCEVGDGIYEASAVVLDDVRARAVAVRLERGKQVWRVTELVIG